jgi:hypothetical protein
MSAEDHLEVSTQGHLLVLQRGHVLVLVNFGMQPIGLSHDFVPANMGLGKHTAVLTSSAGALSTAGQLSGNSCAWLVRERAQPLA